MTADRLFAALDDLEGQLRTLGIDLAAAAAPGATDAELDRVTEETGIVLPDEARAWFRWHNGTAEPNDDFTHPLRTAIAPGWNLTSITSALATYSGFRHVKETTAIPEGWGHLVADHLFPVVIGPRRGAIVVHTAGPTPGGLDVLDFHVDLPGPEPALRSLSSYIEQVASGVREGIVIAGHEHGLLDLLPDDQLPPEYRTILF